MKRKIIAIISTITVFALLLTGTFAWINLSQAMVNEFSGDAEESGGTLHDDFDGDEQKDVYIENWGSTTIFVRIRLDEFMEVGSGASGKGAGGGTPSWIPNPSNQAKSLMTNTANDPNNNIDDVNTWTPHIPDVNDVTTCTTVADFHHYWQWKMGGQKWYRPADASNRTNPIYVDQNTNIYNGTNPLDKQTANSTGKVVTMAQWKAMGSPINQDYWVIDVDGWAYWAGKLLPDHATGLLLNGVKKIITPDDSWYYAINVIAQMGTKTGDQNVFDWGDNANGGWTKDGNDLVDMIVNESNPTISDITITSNNGIRINNTIFLKQGEAVQLTANVNITNGSNAVTWSHNGNTGFTFTSFNNTADITTQNTIPAGNVYNVTAVSVQDITKTATVKIVIIDKNTAGVVVGEDGKLYLDYGDNTFREIDNNGAVIGNLICGGMNEKPGDNDDRYDIVITQDGAKLLGPNVDGSYQSKGPDGKLGTLDDEYWWRKDPNKPVDQSKFPDDFTHTPPAAAVVISVNITPNTATLDKNETKAFDAVVLMTGGIPATGADKNVTWSIIPSSAGTITSAGVLKVSANPNVTEFQIKATSVNNPSIFGTAIVKMKPQITEVPNGSDGRTLDSTKTGDRNGIVWVEIATNGEYSLIVRSNYLNVYPSGMKDDPAWQYITYGPSTNYTDGNNRVRNAINNWFKGTAGSAADNLPANARLRDFTVKNTAISALGSGTATSGSGINDGFSKPTTEADRTGLDVAFALSYGEAANFLSKTYSYGGGQSSQSSNLAKNNFDKITIPSDSSYGSMWLRSPGVSPNVSDLEYYGRVFHKSISENGLVYPAVWVHQDIFN